RSTVRSASSQQSSFPFGCNLPGAIPRTDAPPSPRIGKPVKKPLPLRRVPSQNDRRAVTDLDNGPESCVRSYLTVTLMVALAVTSLPAASFAEPVTVTSPSLASAPALSVNSPSVLPSATVTVSFSNVMLLSLAASAFSVMSPLTPSAVTLTLTMPVLPFSTVAGSAVSVSLAAAAPPPVGAGAVGLGAVLAGAAPVAPGGAAPVGP